MDLTNEEAEEVANYVIDSFLESMSSGNTADMPEVNDLIFAVLELHRCSGLSNTAIDKEPSFKTFLKVVQAKAVSYKDLASCVSSLRERIYILKTENESKARLPESLDSFDLF